VRPILHEPGPINMTAFTTETGFPVAAGQSLRLNSAYENSRPHTRVMGIMLAYLAPDPAVTEAEACGPLPGDVETLRTDKPGRPGPVPFRVPLTGLDDEGKAVDISAPPGPLRPLSSGAAVTVGDRYFSPRNVVVQEGARLRWRFFGGELHNLTLANGPEGIGSPNLNDGRAFSHRFREPGTYRFFCAIHPVDMSERVVVRPRG
jgi:plastocyanin